MADIKGRRIPNALHSIEFRNMVEAKGAPYWHGLTSWIKVGYKRTKSGNGSWKVRYVDAENGTTKEVTVGDADDVTAADGKNVLTYDQVVAKVPDLVRQMGYECPDPRMFHKPPNAKDSLDMLRGMTSHRRAAERVGEMIERQREEPPVMEPPVAAMFPERAPMTMPGKPLGENKAALDGMSKAIRGLRSAHEAMCENDPRALMIAANFFAGADDCFCEALRQAGILPTVETETHGTGNGKAHRPQA